MGERLEKALFVKNLNSTFRTRIDSEELIELELVSMREIPSAANQEQFALLFRGPADIYLPQRIYPLEHDRMGNISLFLVPVGREENGYMYEAVFNRFIK